MSKRKLQIPYHPSKKSRKGDFWPDFQKSFFGTLSDPVGTLVSLARGHDPSWNRNKGWRNITTFDHRKGFIGGLLGSLGVSYLKKALEGGLDALTRKSGNTSPAFIQHLLLNKTFDPSATFSNFNAIKQRRGRSMPHPDYMRNSGISDMLFSLLQNQTVRDYGKKAALTGASYLLPRLINWISGKFSNKNNV